MTAAVHFASQGAGGLSLPAGPAALPGASHLLTWTTRKTGLQGSRLGKIKFYRFIEEGHL